MSRRRPVKGPSRPVLTQRALVRAAFLAGRGYPMEDVARRMKVDRRTLSIEFARHGVTRSEVEPALAEPTFVLELRLPDDERRVLARSAMRRQLYGPALAGRLVRTVLQGGEILVDNVLDDGGGRG